MQIVLFSDRLVDVRSNIRHVHQKKHSTVLVESFLEKVYGALREEVSKLPREARTNIPVFQSVYDLSERYHSSKSTGLEISSALLCICQLAHFIGYFEKLADQYPTPSEDSLIVGLGLGQLAATAVVCSNTVLDLIPLAVQAVRLAFRVGATVETVSRQSHDDNETEESWSMIVQGDVGEIESDLQHVQDEINVPKSGRAYVSHRAKDACIISGQPSRLRQLRSSRLFQGVQTEELSTFGYWHASHVHQIDEIADIVEPCLLDIDDSNRPPRTFLSTATGKPTAVINRKRLFTEAVDQILRKPINWGCLRQTIIDFSKNESKFSDCILGYENSFMSKDVLSTIQSERTKPIDFQDLADTFRSLYADDKAHSRTKNSNIAVIGYSCRLPGAPGNDDLWQLLVDGRDMHKKIPEDRFNVETHFDPSGKKTNASHSPFGCFIEEPGLFDPRFFNMSPREATETDPMHRLALVTAYEALEQSGFVANSTASTQQDRVGTFYGQTCDDWREVNAAQNIGTYFIPGGVRAFAPGRISYYFGFRGPSYSVDTACSSSLAAIQIACTSLQTGECDTALAGGVNVLTAPDIFAGLSRGQFLSKSGSCKTWDSKADGYCRADGVGSIVLKREEDAIADKDNIYGVILASATNHSADAVSITHPHAGNQSYLYRSILHSAGVDPLKVSYVELHGTGTQAGDMTEITSVTDVFAPEKDGRSLNPEQALHIGAVKSNLGHSEAAAGITALIKVILMMRENIIPPHVGIKNELNPGFPSLEARNVHIPFEKTKWSQINGEPRFAFVNNFSAAGGNTGLVIRDPLQRFVPQDKDLRGVFPFVLSSKSISSLHNNIKLLISYIDQMPEDSLPSLSYTLARRIHHNYRVGVVASNIATLKTSLQKNLEESSFAPLSSKIPKATFVFTGQGGFYPGLGKQLYELSTIFRNEVVRLNELAITQELPAFLPAIDGSVSQNQELSPSVVQLALVCVQMALVKLWQSWGIQPSAVIGHSLGEYPALYAAGVLSADDTLHLVGSRAKLLQEKCTANSHMMLAVKASVAEIESKIKGVPYEYACFNSLRDTVLSGAVDDIDKVDKTLIQAGYKCVRMNLPYAFHSAQIEPVLGEFEKIAGGAIFNKPNIPVISSLLGEVVEENGVFGPTYLRRQAREPVNLTEALQVASDDGFISSKTAFIEIGPHPICSSMVKAVLGGDMMTAASLKKADNPWKTISQSLCSLHGQGLEVDWRQFHADFESSHELLRLPSYSFDNKTYWIPYVNDWCLHKTEPRHEEPAEAIQAPSPVSTTSIQRIVSQEFANNVGTVVAQSDLSEPSLRAAVLGHLVNGVGLCPSSIYADMAFTLGDFVYKKMKPDTEFSMNCGDMEVVKPLIVKKGSTDSLVLQISITLDLSKQKATLRYATVNLRGEETVVHAQCTITYEQSPSWSEDWASNSYLIEGRIDTLKDRLAKNETDQISRGLAYKLFSALVSYDPKFQGMEEVILDSKNFEATSRVNFKTEEKDGTFFCSPFWIDSLAHLSGFILNGSDAVDSKNFVFVSHGWRSMRLAKPLDRNTTYNSYVKMQPAPNNVMQGDVYIFEGKIIIGIVGGLKFQRIPRAMLNSFLPPEGGSAAPVKQESSPSLNSSTDTDITASGTSTPKNSRSKLTSGISSSIITKSAESASSLPSKPVQKPPSGNSVVNGVMKIVSQETDLPPSELLDACLFSDLGVDSLLSLQICGRIREALNIDIPSSAFVDNETIGELRKYLQKFEGAAETAPSDSAVPETTSSSALSEDSDEGETTETSQTSTSTESFEGVGSPKKVSPVSASSDTLMLFRKTISEQMGVAIEEVVGANDLVSLGMDSLMSICILGIIREQTGLDFSSSFFLDNPSIDAIEQYLGLGHSVGSASTPPKRKKISKMSTPASTTTPATPLSQAVSILMQGKPKTATKTLFLFPDGSGSATSYSSIPAIGPKVAIYGLNSPFMTNPSDFTNGIPGIASLYLDEVKRRQPKGPYYLGGWSAGGVVAYEATIQLLAAGERVADLILFDSPCPIKLEPLPGRLHRFFADIGLFGGPGVEPPAWLLGHFESSIKALAAYDPPPIEDKSLIPRVLAVWARQGVCGGPDDPKLESREDDPKSMKWLLENRTDFGTNGWEALVGEKAMRLDSIDGNHFTLMKDREQLNRLAGMLRDFL